MSTLIQVCAAAHLAAINEEKLSDILRR